MMGLVLLGGWWSCVTVLPFSQELLGVMMETALPEKE